MTVDVWNDTKEEDIVHWHGFHIPSEVDGAYEEGTPGVPPNGGRRRYIFTPDPAGSRWYHSHTSAGRNLRKSTYTGQFGLFVVDGGDDPGAYDQEVPILLHEWEPRFTTQGAMDVEFKYFSINGKMLGAGEPIRVKPSQRVLFRIVNASATLHHRLALPGHLFQRDRARRQRRAVPDARADPRSRPRRTRGRDRRDEPARRLDPRRSADRTTHRRHGHRRRVRRRSRVRRDGSVPGPSSGTTRLFGGRDAVPEPDGRLTMVFKATGDGHHWTINGKSYPRTDPIVVQPEQAVPLDLRQPERRCASGSPAPSPIRDRSGRGPAGVGHLERRRRRAGVEAGGGRRAHHPARPVALPLPSAVPHGHGLHGDDAILELNRLRAMTLNACELEIDLFCRGMRVPDDVSLEGVRGISRTRAGLGSGLEIVIPGGSWLKDHVWVNVPVVERFAASLPVSAARRPRAATRSSTIEPPAVSGPTARPADWYSRNTTREIPMSRIGVLQGTYLGIYLNMVCTFWNYDPPLNCQFCTTGQNVGENEETYKALSDVVETCRAARDESGVTFVHLNGGFQGIARHPVHRAVRAVPSRRRSACSSACSSRPSAISAATTS